MANRVRAIGAKLRQLAANKARDIALEVTSNLTNSTPVDTGLAHWNWIPSIGAPQAVQVGDKKLANVALSAQSTAIAALASYRGIYAKHFVANCVSYIRRLNAGSSKQAPALFVESSVAQAVATVKSR